MGFSGGPWFVVKKDVAANVLYVSHGYDPQTAYKQQFPIHDFHSIINGQMPGERVTLKIRHTPEYLPARLEAQGDGRFLVHADALSMAWPPGASTLRRGWRRRATDASWCMPMRLSTAWPRGSSALFTTIATTAATVVAGLGYRVAATSATVVARLRCDAHGGRYSNVLKA